LSLFPWSVLNDAARCNKYSLSNVFWFKNFNLIQSVGNRSCSISGLFQRNPEKNHLKFCHCSSCADRNSNVSTAPLNTLFLVTAFQAFTCDILFVSVIRNYEINIILNKIAFLRYDRVNLSDWAECFDINYDFFILLKPLK